ncbi:MAG: hypothetical protein ACXW3B_12455 [Telluria sp.]
MSATTSLAHVRPMPGWVKGSLLAVPVFGACWGGAIWYWRASSGSPETSDLFLFLVALPVGLFLAFWLGRKVIEARLAVPATVTPDQAAMATAAPEAPPLAILAASLRSPHGASPEELATTIADRKARADLDQELVDDNGFPVMTARCIDARDDALQEEITDWLSLNNVSELSLNDEQWRAIAMATVVAGELASKAACDLIPTEGVAPVLHLMPILPPEWKIEQRRVVGVWLRHSVAQFGWPSAQVTVAVETAEPATLSAVLGHLSNHAAAKDTPLAAIIVACASHIGDASVAQWVEQTTLFAPSRPHGQIPGEGAAGLLVTDVGQARTIDDAVFVVLGPACEARRDSSTDDIKRADATALLDVAMLALKRGAAELSDVAMIVADTGHRSNRMDELMGLALPAMPQLDAAVDVVSVGLATGTCGAVPFVTALALARHHVLERDASVLCISNEDPFVRSAVLLQPANTVPR